MSKAIALIGLPGCGKSTYAKILSNKLSRPVYDIDALIEARTGLSITAIFEQRGEAYFRELEWSVFCEYAQNAQSIIATGGGLVPFAYQSGFSKPDNVFFVFLNPPLEEIVRRLENPDVQAQRPLLIGATNLTAQMTALYEKRHEAYEAWADEVLCTF